MLRTNLATRPFYNERAVYLVLGLVAVVGLGVIYLEVQQIRDLSRRNTQLTARAESAESDGADLLELTADIQRSISAAALDEVAAAAREANLLIDQRVFSWSDFFNRIETTLPPDVMLTDVRPDIDPGLIMVTMGVLGRTLDVITDFIVALEESGAFTGIPGPDWTTEDGMYRAVVQGQYLQTPLGPAGDDEAEASSRAEEPEDSGPEADADSAPEAAPVDRDTFPDADDEPSPGGEPEAEDAPPGDGQPDVDPEPPPAGPAGDPS